MKVLPISLLIIVNLFQCTYPFKNERNAGLAEKISHLKDLSAKKGYVKLNNVKFKDHVKFPGRNYSFIIMFTALEAHRQCTICKPVHEEFVIVAKSFQIGHRHSDKLFFGIIDFDDGSDIFQKLQINTAPLIVHFPANRKVNRIGDVQTLDMQRLGFSAEAIARWITDKTDLEFRIYRPPDYVSSLGLLTLIFIGSVVMYFKQENFEFLHNRTVWAVVIVSFCLMMTSGQMWNHIRSPPLYHKSANGISYIHGSSQGQFISETYLIFMLNACFAACIIMLVDNGFGKDNSGNKLSTAFAVLFAALLFSAVLSIFKAKAGGYPYRGLL